MTKSMSVLSDEQLMDIARPACGNFRWPSTALDIMRAAIAADRDARAEPVLKVRVGRESIELLKHKVDGRLALPIGDHFLYTAPPAAPVCMTCNGHGLIGGFVSADSGYDSRPCPDCNTPAAPVVPNEEGKHCGDPDCVPCRDPADPAAPVVPECPFPCGWRKLHELMVKDAAWVASQLQAYPDEPLPEHLPQIVFVNQDRALRVVRAMLAAHEAKRGGAA